jgi:hypothetical protein
LTRGTSIGSPDDDFSGGEDEAPIPVSQGQDVVEETRQNAIYIIGRPSTARGTPGIASPIPPPFLTIERPLCG